MTYKMEILLADDDANNAAEIQRGLAGLGFVVSHATSSESAVEQAALCPPQLAIVQLGMAGAVDTARQLQQKYAASLVLSVDSEQGIGDTPMAMLKPVGLLSRPLRAWELSAIMPAAAALAEERLASLERNCMLNSIVEGMLDSVLILNRERQVVFANSTASRLLKRSADELLKSSFDSIFPGDADGNNEIKATMDSIFGDSGGAIGSGGRGTIDLGGPGPQQVVVIANPVRAASGKVSAVSLSFRAAPPAQKPSPHAAEPIAGKSNPNDELTDLGGRGEVSQAVPGSSSKALAPVGRAAKDNPLRDQAVRAIALRVESKKQNYGVVLVLSQFDMFRMRYGLNSAERLLHALSAQVMKTLPSEDRLYQWSSRALIALCERNSSLDEVRLEMTALCSRRVDYFLNAPERSALVTLSATWTLLPLYGTTLEKVIDQVQGFERQHSRGGI